MGDYVEIKFFPVNAERSAILIAKLSGFGYDGFEEDESILKAFIAAEEYNDDVVSVISSEIDVRYSSTIIQETNWNELWESNFPPVRIDDFVSLRAEFHPEMSDVEHEIVITPKMSFGTGHHATTHMMIQQMRGIDFNGKSVFDFGTGTGILAILAEKLGASRVVAIDNDDWSIANAAENMERNNCQHIDLQKAESLPAEGGFDVILANINKNIILQNYPELVSRLANGGVLLLSGLLPEDKDDIFRKNSEYSLQILDTQVRSNWLCIKLSR